MMDGLGAQAVGDEDLHLRVLGRERSAGFGGQSAPELGRVRDARPCVVGLGLDDAERRDPAAARRRRSSAWIASRPTPDCSCIGA